MSVKPMILATAISPSVGSPNQELLVLEGQTPSACRRRRSKAEDGAKDCHSQHDILYPVWPVASDSHCGVPYSCCRDEYHQFRPPSPTREGTCSHNSPWGWSNVDTPRPS